MKLKSFNYFLGLLIIFLYSPLLSEEKIDIWKNKKELAVDSPNQEDNDIWDRAVKKIKVEDRMMELERELELRNEIIRELQKKNGYLEELLQIYSHK